MNDIRENLKKNPLYYTHSISIELSNICNYSHLHKLCPAHYRKEKKVMSLELIEKILIELRDLGFDRTIYPFGYSEPLIDPRFFLVLDMIKKYIPKADIKLYTNGFFLDKTMIRELENYDIKKMTVSYYMPEEEERISKILKEVREEGIANRIRGARRYPCEKTMNNKVEWYDRKPINSKIPCNAPLGYLGINVDGNVTLCCHDWKYFNTFGSVKKQTLREIITSDKVISTFNSLRKGERYKFFLCSRCTKYR